MSKKSFYFSHDNNARNDEKILAVRMELGAEGYGIYFMLLEKLLETENYILIKDYNRLAFDVRVSSEKIKAVIENFGLFQFTDDGKQFYSESLIRRMQPLDAIRKQRSEAGKKSAEKRQRVKEGISQTQQIQRPLQENLTTAERPLQENSTKKVKESKVNVLLEKEPKEREYIGEGNFSENPENSEPLNSEQKQKEKSSAKKEKVFTPPTIQEVQDYCTERQNGIDAEIFWNFYQSKGWMVGKNKMKDWKSCVITWEKSRKKENADNRNNQQYATGYKTTKPSSKTSYRTLVAREFSKNSATPNDSENITINIEAVQ